MLRWYCAAMVVLCSMHLSMSAVLQTRQRIRSLRSLQEAVRAMGMELEQKSTLLPELLGKLAIHAAQPAAGFLSAAAAFLEKREGDFPRAWNQALKETDALCLLPEEAQALRNLGGILGRFGAERQAEEIRRTESRLALFLELEEKEHMKRNKVRAAVGAGAGLMLAILLL